MPDDPSKKGAADRGRVSGQDHEVSYLQEKYGVSRSDVEEAQRAVGPARDRVEAYLARRHSESG